MYQKSNEADSKGSGDDVEDPPLCQDKAEGKQEIKHASNRGGRHPRLFEASVILFSSIPGGQPQDDQARK